jgi:hypothetical protein
MQCIPLNSEVHRTMSIMILRVIVVFSLLFVNGFLPDFKSMKLLEHITFQY